MLGEMQVRTTPSFDDVDLKPDRSLKSGGASHRALSALFGCFGIHVSTRQVWYGIELETF